MWQVLSVQTGRVREMEGFGLPAQRAWHSATRKEVVQGPVRLTTLGFAGDEQADQDNHGGEDKALLFYAAVHYARWMEEIPGVGMGPGGFGENLMVDADEEEVSVGDIFAIGEAIVQVSQPRVPCWKQALRWGVDDLVERMQTTGRTGYYGRVLRAGDVQAGDSMRLVERPHAEVTVARLSRARYGGCDPAEMRELAKCTALADVWRRWLVRAG